MTAKGTESVLYSFQGGNDGQGPNPGLIRDNIGNLYGTTLYGGGSGCGGVGCGTIFRLSLNNVETVLYTFSGGSDGGSPNGALIADKSGNLYGTTSGGGTGCYGYGCGTIFKFSSSGTLTTLYSFTGGNDGTNPSSLVADRKGNFYGTTLEGGPYEGGTIFKFSSSGAESILYAFDGYYDNEWAFPLYSVTLDSSGDIFTPVQNGGVGCGVIFELAADGTPSALYTFTGGNDGCYSDGGLIIDGSGNLYGDTNYGGANGDGTVDKISPSGKETTLHAFAGADGSAPTGGLVADKKHDLYGATYYGGSANDGTVFRLKE